jgi:hypothetical protein
MADDGERRIRPALWVIFGALVVPVGLLLALDAAATATRVGGVEGAPRCATEFAKGCTTNAPPSWTTRATPEGPGGPGSSGGWRGCPTARRACRAPSCWTSRYHARTGGRG